MAKGKNKNNRYKNRYRYRHRKNNSKKSVDIEKNTNNVIINETTQDENINTTELTDAIDKLFEESEVFARENNEPENITTIEKTSQSELEASEKKNNRDNYEDSPKEDISYVDNKNIDSDTGTEIVPFENTPVDELETDNKKYIPYVIEPSLGADRVALAFLCDAYDEEEVGEGDVRTVLRLHPALAPYKAAVLPLSKKLSEPARELWTKLADHFMVDYDEAGTIGKRYRREDEIGTPFCITYDFESQEDGCVTIRFRDTMEQVRLPMDEVLSFIEERLEF